MPDSTDDQTSRSDPLRPTDTTDLLEKAFEGGIPTEKEKVQQRITQAASPLPINNQTLISPSGRLISSQPDPSTNVNKPILPTFINAKRQISRKKQAAIIAGLSGLGASSMLPGSQKRGTQMRDVYRYVGDDTMKHLPSLRQQAENWVNKMRVNPSLQAISSPKALAEWVKQNPNSGVHMDDYGGYEALVEYQSLFPNGAESEKLQQQLYQESLGEQSDIAEQARNEHGQHTSPHGGSSQLDEMFKPKGLDQDPRFKNTLKNVIREHNSSHPNQQFGEKLFVKVGKDKILNPNLPPALRQEAERLFITANGQEAFYELKGREQSRIYKTQSNDPVIKKMKELAEQSAQKEIYGNGLSAEQQKVIQDRHLKTHTEQFIKDHPEKAAAYARKDPEMKKLYKDYKKTLKAQNKLAWKQYRESKKVYRLNRQKDPALKALKEGRITPAEFVTKYPEKARAYRRTMPEIASARETFISDQKAAEKDWKERLKEAKQIAKHNDPKTDPELQAIRNNYPDRGTNPAQKHAYEKEIEEFTRTRDRAKSKAYQQDPDIISAQNKISHAEKMGKGGFFSHFGKSRRSKERTDLSNDSQSPRPSRRGSLIAALKNAGSRARQNVKQVILGDYTQTFDALKSIGRFAKSGGGKLLNAGFHGASGAPPKIANAFRPAFSSERRAVPFGFARPPIPVAPSWAIAVFTNPGVLAGIIVVILLLILFGELFKEEGEVSVRITKTGPEQVPNPSASTPTEFTYRINGTYSGNPSSISVTDYLPPEVEYVSATGPNPSYNSGNHTVTWNLQGLAGTGTGGGGGGGGISDPCEVGAPNTPKWQNINEYDAYFAGASKEFGVPAHVLKSMAYIESGGAGHYVNGSVITGSDQYGGGASVGIMQIKPSYWSGVAEGIGADLFDPEGNIRTAAKLMSDWTAETGSWENAITQRYHPGTGQHGTTQSQYVATVKSLMTELDAAVDCSNTDTGGGNSIGRVNRSGDVASAQVSYDVTTSIRGVLQAQTSPSPSATSAASSGGPGRIPELTVTVRVKSDVQNTYIINRAVALATGGGSASRSAGTGLPGQPLPDGGPEEIKRVLCDDYKVCPTRSSASAPDQDWTLTQLTALWNVVQKIYASPLYKQYAIGNNPLEISRVGCYPGGCDDTNGYFAGMNSSWASIPESRLVMITNAAPKEGSVEYLEWLIAHEIGHGASGGSADGSPPLNCLTCNTTALELISCGTPVSNYSTTNSEEYVAEAISYYMTNAEAATGGYRGGSVIGSTGNMKDDFACLYNAARNGYFDGVEY